MTQKEMPDGTFAEISWSHNIGEKSDPKQSDPDSSASLISLMKGMVAQNAIIIAKIEAIETLLTNGISVSLD